MFEENKDLGLKITGEDYDRLLEGETVSFTNIVSGYRVHVEAEELGSDE